MKNEIIRLRRGDYLNSTNQLQGVGSLNMGFKNRIEGT